jgi:hypothetical protein
LVGAMVGDTVLDSAVVDSAAVALPSVGLAEAAGVTLAVGVGVGDGEAVSAATCDGAGGKAWTAEPLLVPLAISATITTSVATTTPMTATRRTQYV